MLRSTMPFSCCIWSKMISIAVQYVCVCRLCILAKIPITNEILKVKAIVIRSNFSFFPYKFRSQFSATFKYSRIITVDFCLFQAFQRVLYANQSQDDSSEFFLFQFNEFAFHFSKFDFNRIS